MYGICLEETEPLFFEAPLVAEGKKENGEGSEDERINLRESVSSVSSVCLKNLENITLVPNPTTGELKIENGELKINNVEVFDVYGRKVGAEFPSNSLEGWQPQADGVVFNISHLNSGIYFVKITTEAGEIVKKVIKQ